MNRIMKRIALCLLVLIFSATRSSAQVNPQTGSATFSLPIFNWQDNYSRLKSVIALSYNSGNGLKVDDIASNVGQGWSMVAGGVISRMQVALPDDQVANSGNYDDIRKYPPGILYATEPASKGCPLALTKYPLFRNKNQKYAQHNVIGEDKELDYFSYQFNGKAGIFVLDPTQIGVAQNLGDTKMTITFLEADLSSQNIRTKITSFTIQDVDGLIYKFSVHGLTKVLESNYCDASLNYLLTQPKLQGSDRPFHQMGFENSAFVKPWVISSWYLEEIKDPFTNRIVTFTYGETRNINTIAGEDIIYNAEKDYAIINHKKTIIKTPALTAITYPDGHTATFRYATAERIDFPGEKAISAIDIAYNGRYLSSHELTTTYIMRSRYGTPVTEYQKKIARLYLLSVRKIGPDLKEDTPPYIFDYYTGSGVGDDFVPPRFFYMKDIWGFYNGTNSMGYWLEGINLSTDVSLLSKNQLRGLCFMRSGVSGVVLNAKAGYAKNGLLKQIIYPTGGTLTYDYEQNTGIISGQSSSTNVGGVHVSFTKSTDGNSCSNEIKTKYDYVLSGGGSSLWGLELPVNTTFSRSHYEPEQRYYKWDVGCGIFGCCEWRFKFPGIMLQQQAINLSTIQNILESAGPALNILSILGTANDIVQCFSNNPTGLIINAIVSVIEVAVTCVGNQARNNNYTSFFNFDLNSASPLPAQFKRVEITENPGASPGMGVTIQTFTSDDDYPIWVGPGANSMFTSKQRFASWVYGLPKLSTVKDANGNKIRETENIYDTTYIKRVIHPCSGHPGLPCGGSSGLGTNMVACKCVVVENTSQNIIDWSNSTQYNNSSSYLTSSNSSLNVDRYAMYTGRLQLSSTKERVYKQNDQTQYVETVTDYLYNYVYNYEPYQISTQRSDGDINIKYIKYTSDFSGGVINTLLANNVVALPISTMTAVYRPSVFLKYLDEKVTEFTQVSNGDIKPYRLLEQRFDQPVMSSSFTSYTGPGGSVSNYKVTQTLTYDASGNLIGMKDEGNRMITNLYGYNDKYIVASFVNADASLDKCSYGGFEETATWSGWSLTGTASYNASVSVTGNRSFNLSSATTFSSNLNTSKAYTLSFWATSSGVTASSGATLIKSSPTINGFTYYEYDIIQGTSSISLSGTSTIDELRLYPKTARMRSITYDPIIGKTSECDENNRITYYDYDNLGRLKFIKDANRNIVKMYEYNNVSASKQNGCPQTYYNKYISEIFIKTCGAGYINDTVTYNVPANMFSSAISQADADVQAENYLLTNGQSYANSTGTCRPLYYNTQQSQTFTSETCPPGYKGGSVTYTVPANRYSSLVSQTAANQLALDEIYANGQAYANDPTYRVCTYNSNPVWEWVESGDSYCDNGVLYILEKDYNPNSSTYNTTRWKNTGANDDCPVTMVGLTYTNNTAYSQFITVTNTSTSDSYFFFVDPYSSGTLGYVPEGTYNVDIYDSYGYSYNSYHAGCDFYSYGYTANFYNVPFNSSCSVITIFDFSKP